jgi:hypothetical protein
MVLSMFKRINTKIKLGFIYLPNDVGSGGVAAYPILFSDSQPRMANYAVDIALSAPSAARLQQNTKHLTATAWTTPSRSPQTCRGIIRLSTIQIPAEACHWTGMNIPLSIIADNRQNSIPAPGLLRFVARFKFLGLVELPTQHGVIASLTLIMGSTLSCHWL